METKAEVLSQTDSACQRLLAVLDRVDEPHGTWPGAVGEWSVLNLVQHLAGWLNEMTPALERMSRGERPGQEGVDYSDPDPWNAGFVERAGEQSLGEARAELERAHAAFRAAIDSVAADRFGEGKTVNRLVDLTAIEHFDEHREQIEGFLSGAS